MRYDAQHAEFEARLSVSLAEATVCVQYPASAKAYLRDAPGGGRSRRARGRHILIASSVGDGVASSDDLFLLILICFVILKHASLVALPHIAFA